MARLPNSCKFFLSFLSETVLKSHFIIQLKEEHLTQTVVSIVRQMEPVITRAAIVAGYVVAFVHTTTVRLQVTLINV